MKRGLIIFSCLLVAGCATVDGLGIKGTGRVLTQSSGSFDITKTKIFSVANTAEPGSINAGKEESILKYFVFRLQQEGLKYSKEVNQADILFTLTFLDANGQKYIPPVAYTTVTYNANTSANINGVGTEMNNFVTFNGTVNAQTAGTATATTHVRNGYFVPTYGVGVALNIFDVKTKQLLWYGSGVVEADIRHPGVAVDDIILTVIDKYLITPAFVSNKREEIRESYSKRYKQEYLMNTSADGKNHVGVVNHLGDDVTVLSKVLVINGEHGQMMKLSFIIQNKCAKEFIFDPAAFRLTINGNEAEILTKSKVAEMLHGSKNFNADHVQGSGLIGFVLASAYNGIADGTLKSRNKQIDDQVRFVLETYLDKVTVKPGGDVVTYAYLGSFTYLPDNADVRLSMQFAGKAIDVDYKYQPSWMSVEQWDKILRNSSR